MALPHSVTSQSLDYSHVIRTRRSGGGVCFLYGRRAGLSSSRRAVNQLSVEALTMFPLCSAAAAQSGRHAEKLSTCVCSPLTVSVSVCVFDLQVAQSQNKVYLSADSLVLNLQDKDSFR